LIVTLIPDIWEKHFIHRLRLGAIVTLATFERQLLIIEKVKQVTESTVNNYDFNKAKL